MNNSPTAMSMAGKFNFFNDTFMKCDIVLSFEVMDKIEMFSIR